MNLSSWFHLNIHFHVGTKEAILACPVRGKPSGLLALFGLSLFLTLAIAGAVIGVAFPVAGVIFIVVSATFAAFIQYVGRRAVA